MEFRAVFCGQNYIRTFVYPMANQHSFGFAISGAVAG
jgi:hypothetical protein